MAQYSNKITSFCKEGNNIDGSTNFQAWKKRIDFIFVENEVTN